MLKIKKIRPMFTSLITTMDKYEQDVKIGGLIDTTRQQGGLKEYQKVLAVGNSVRDIKVGDVVCVNPAAMKRKAEAYGIVGLNFISYDDIIRSNQLYNGDVWIADKYVIDEISNFLSAFFGGECVGFTQTED